MWSKDPGWNHKDLLQFLTTCGKISAAHCFVLGVGKHQKLQSRGSSSTFLLGRLVLEGKLSLPALVWKAVLSMERLGFGVGWREKQTTPLAVILFTSQTAFSLCFWISWCLHSLVPLPIVCFSSSAGCVQALLELGPELICLISASVQQGIEVLSAFLCWIEAFSGLNAMTPVPLQSNFSVFWILKSFELLLIMCYFRY